MRLSFWLWLGVWLITWSGALLYDVQERNTSLPYLFMMTAIFFTIFFFTSLAKQQFATCLLWFLMTILINVIFAFPLHSYVNPFIWIMCGLIVAIAGEYLRAHYLWTMLLTVITTLFILHIQMLTPIMTLLLVLISFLLTIAILFYQKNAVNVVELKLRYQALLQAHRQLKRRTISNESHARQQERLVIGREIHDRVGHSLTNLLMQIEMLRIKGNNQSTSELSRLKVLAKDSLQETRQAVKALKNEKATGIAAIIPLIRKLEAEHLIAISFSMQKNALSVSLTAEQTSVVYRAIQESLTNVMRHSKGKEATIILEAPGSTHFSFEVTNPTEEQLNVREGFGIQSMRDRLDQINGKLEVKSYKDRFIVRGMFPINEKGEEHDKNFISGRSSVGPTRD